MKHWRRAAIFAALTPILACAADDADARDVAAVAHAQGRLLARVSSAAPAGDVARGKQPLGLGTHARDGILYVPQSYRRDKPAPLVVLLHGAGGTAQHGLGLLAAYAERTGTVLLAPDSRAPSSWDIITDDAFGPDVAYIDRALTHTFSRVAIDKNRIAVGGFSDGASYALSLGITNGDLFRDILAFSPGFAAPGVRHGKPRIYVSHGTKDTVLPIERCSRRLVPTLVRAGYDVRYVEFDGPHWVPPEHAKEALDRALAP